MQLYNHFKSKFEQKIIDFGEEKMKIEVDILHKYNKNFEVKYFLVAKLLYN